ncbi:MAG: hypothetical protein K0R67_910 [Paenibacillus sp.]|nr:hypothetical protein [Paenibacillus sp.]
MKQRQKQKKLNKINPNNNKPAMAMLTEGIPIRMAIAGCVGLAAIIRLMNSGSTEGAAVVRYTFYIQLECGVRCYLELRPRSELLPLAFAWQ